MNPQRRHNPLPKRTRVASSPSLVWEHAKVGSPLEDVVCLPEDGPRTARVVKGQVGAGQLQRA